MPAPPIDVSSIQVTDNQTYRILGMDSTSSTYDVGIGYFDTTSVILTWQPDQNISSDIINIIKSYNPSIQDFYTVVWDWDNDYKAKLTSLGFNIVNTSAIGNPPEDCVVYLYNA